MLRNHFRNSIYGIPVTIAGVLLLGAAVAFGQQQVNLTATATTATLPDGRVVPMWGYFCGAAVTGSTAACAALNPASVAAGTWSPVVITVPTGQALTINLTNNLSFVPAGAATANSVPTSLTIVGQLGGGLGTSCTAASGATCVASPAHSPVGVTWSTVNTAVLFNPPPQGERVQSFSTEVAAGATTSLTWTAPRPGTYLLESGTHPSIQGPMGLFGMVVVTCSAAQATALACTTATTGLGTAYPAVGTTPAVTYGGEIPLLMGEIDPVQNNAVNTAVNSPGFNEMTMRTFGDQVTSITVTSGGSGYTSNPTVTVAAGCATAPCAGGTGAGSGATATASVGKVVTGLALPSTGSGSGYTAPPAVTITDTVAPITAASATAVMAVGAITAPATTGTGSGYVLGDRVSFTGGAGGAASGTVATVCAAGSTTCAAGAILTVNVTNAGTDYTSVPTAVVGGTGATLTPVLSTTTAGTVGSVTVTAGGSGYVVGDIVTFTGTSTTAATATVGTVSPLGAILTVTITNAGAGYTAAPTATVGGTGAALTVMLAVTGFTVTNGGSGYTAPTATIPGPTTGSAAITLTVSTAGTTGSVYSISLSSGGSAYNSPPAVTIAAPTTTGGLPATAVAVLGQSCKGGGGCYPSAVNYTPLYYTFNGVAFNKSSTSASLFPTIPATGLTAGTGTILVRLVNAGLRMHVPSIVGSLTTGPNVAGGTTAGPTVGGFTLIAEDGYPLPPQAPRVQTDVFMAAGKTFDVMINVPAAGVTALPIYDRELSLSANSVGRDGGMLAYISANSAALPTTGVFASLTAVANPDTYNSVVPCTTAPCTPVVVSDPGKGVIANDVNVYGVKLSTAPTKGTLTLNADGTFTYVPNVGWTGGDTFVYQANGNGPTATVTLGAATIEAATGITARNNTFTASLADYIAVKPPGALAGFTDAAGYPLTIDLTTVALGAATGTALGGVCGATVTSNCVNVDPNGGFTIAVGSTDAATAAAAGGTYSFTFQAKNSQGTHSATATATVIFPAGSGLTVSVVDGKSHAALSPQDYRWILEEDQSFFIDPACTTNPPATGCPTAASGIVPTLGVNFHTSHMPYVALGCTGLKSCEQGQTVVDTGTPCISANNPVGCSTTAGQHIAAVCDVGNGACRPDSSNSGKAWVWPSQVHLDPAKRYYLSVLPGDAANPFYGAGTVGHGMGGAPIPALCGPQSIAKTACPAPTAAQPAYPAVTVLSEPSPYPPGKLAVFVFEDDFPLDGEFNGSGALATDLYAIEPGLGGFQIHLWDAMGGNGDFTGQMSFDMFNNYLSNYLDGTIDPVTGLNACPITRQGDGVTSMIVTCPKYESDGKTLSPLAGQAVINNLMPGRWGAIATPGADRIARGEEWLQTNTLDGQKAHDVFTRIYEPSFFQEYGPASFHVSIGFANPAIINARLKFVCNGTDPNSPTPDVPINCNNTITGRVVGERLSRPPDERLYGSGSRDAYAWTQCFVSVGDPDGEDFAFTKCDADGRFTIAGLPDGDWRFTTFDQWNDQLVDGLSTPVRLAAGASAATTNVGDIAATQWQTNLQTITFADDNKDGIHQAGETGIPFLNAAVRLRDGSLENLLLTDFTGTANFNETFPLFSWYTVETDTTRYKNTGTHVVYDVGGPADGTLSTCGGTVNGTGYPPCGNSTIGKYLANTAEVISVPTTLRVPGAIYCATADCTGKSMLTGSASDPPSVCTTTAATTTSPATTTCSTHLSSGRIDPPWVGVEGWQGFPGQFSFLEFGKEPYVPGENGGIKGHVVYAATRPFDDPMMLVQTQWTPLIPHVTINLYQEGFASDGVTPTLTLVDTAQTSSFDEWAQGFRSDGQPYMNCPGQGAAASQGLTGSTVTPDLFFFSLYNQPQYLDWYNSLHGGPAPTALPYNSQFKCFDGMHNWNQLQPAPYDGMYAFPSVNSRNPTTGKPQASSASISAISEAGNSVTVATATTHGLVSGAQVTIAGAPAGYNSADYTPAKLFPISVTGPKTFTYAVPASGLAAGTAGSVSAFATNCTICAANNLTATTLPTTDWYYGFPQLPLGKYVVEMVLPAGYELVKEEDKNILIGDNFIAPAFQVYPNLSAVFILPDQASVASWWNAGYNPNNNQNPTNSFGAHPNNGIVPGFVPEPTWPCVGQLRVVPDYISMYPQSKQVSPFAGATRNLCDRKEVTLSDQSHSIAKFWAFTTTHIASKFYGGITDDYTSEFDPFSPQFGEKFAPPDLPVSIKDWTGQEISRVYTDQWGAYNGMTYSTWEVNPPNPTGYSPTMMVYCMNDPGPILDQRPTILNPAGVAIPNPTFGQMITDPQFTEGYSQFCYELPFMPGTTQYLDTPVVPTSAFAGAGYNNVDCNYPDATPAVKEVDGDGIGPWVSAAGNTLTITALGDQMVPNHAYSGPAATTAPYNQKYIRRHYGFGATTGSVTIGGVPATVTSWSDSKIVVTVPSGVSNCAVQQQTIYGGSAAQCGELVISTSGTTTGGGGGGSGSGSVTGVNITNAGSYPSATGVTVSFSGGGGTGAAGTVVLGRGIASVRITNNGGRGYTSAPSVIFTGGGSTASGAAATANMLLKVKATTDQPTGVPPVTITNDNSYPLTGTITAAFTTPPTGTACAPSVAACVTATATAVTTTNNVVSVTITNGGTGYPATGTTVSFGPGGCTVEPTGTVTVSAAGVITAVSITNTGSGCNGTPTVTFNTPTPHTGTTATATAVRARRVTGITLGNAGIYPVGTTVGVTFSAPATGFTQATGTVNTSEYVGSITVTNSGSGYTSVPSVSFSGGTPTSAATATATLATGYSVIRVNLTSGGTGYTSVPTVTFSAAPAGGTTATGAATISGGTAPPPSTGAQRSIDTVTVTIGGKAPTHIAASASVQQAIDQAAPGDLIIIDPNCATTGTTPTQVACSASAINATTPTQTASQASHSELLLMWKPVRLQGVGAASSVILGNTHPAGKLDAWRRQVNCLFGLNLSGAPIGTGANAYDPTGQYSCPGAGWNNYAPDPFMIQVDRLPLEPALGWDAMVNANLAELLQEPSLMGALEGAAITVLSKGVSFPSNPWAVTGTAAEPGPFPTGTTLLQSTIANPNGAQCLNAAGTANPFPSNYECNPSSIDALGITQASQGGGGIFVHGWGHNLQIANDRIYSNAGTLGGGISVGQGEFAPPYIQGSATNAAPGSCEESPVPNIVLPWCQNVNVDVHNNFISLNSSTGDELFSATPAGAGGVNFCTGSDYYKFQYNWVCGNLSGGDGGGVGHLGFSSNGDIEHNTIIFNQSLNPTIPANGGGLVIMGTPDADAPCNINTDADCLPAPGSIGPSDGVGPGLVINANLIMGNSAESGSGGGIAFQAVNGSDMVAFPLDAGQWNGVTVVNNIIVDNIAGWDGGGISLYDSTNVNIINNTIAYNNSTATSGMLFNTLGAPLASQNGSNCNSTATTSCPQVAGVVAIQNSAVLKANLPVLLTCPPGHFQPGTNPSTTGTTPPTCASVSYPVLENNIIYNNASYYIGVGALSATYQQNIVSLYNSFSGGLAANQTTTGQCVTAAGQMWDIGVRGDTGPANHGSGVTLAPSDSVLSSGGYTGSGNSTGNPSFVTSYCDGARTPPEFGASGFAVPPGISDATVPNPIFNLTPVATVDEGNNWVNLRWGPLSMTNPTAIGGANGNYGGGLPLGNYSVNTGSSAANLVTGTNFTDAPWYDFFNRPRKNFGDAETTTDAGAVRVGNFTPIGQFTLSPPFVDFGLIPVHSPQTLDQDLVFFNPDVVPVTITNISLTCTGIGANCNLASFSIKLDPTGNCGIGGLVGPGASCVITVVFNPTSTSQAVRNANLSVTATNGVPETQNVVLTGHDTFGMLYVAPPGGTAPTPGAQNVTVTGTQTTTPTMTPATPSTVAITGIITLTNTENPCLMGTTCAAGSNLNAGPIVPSSITITPLTGTGTWAVAGSCAVGTAINAGGTLVPPVGGSSCTITLTYTPPTGASGTALNGSARLLVQGYGVGSTTTFINAVYNAN